MKNIFLFLFLLPAALVGAASPSPPKNPTHDQLTGFNDEQRKAALAKLLQSSSESCGSATRTFFQMQDDQGRAYWHVACSNGKSYVVRINPDKGGTANVSDCAMMQRLTGGQCFQGAKDTPNGRPRGE